MTKETKVFKSVLKEKIDGKVSHFLRSRPNESWRVKIEGPTLNEYTGQHWYTATLERDTNDSFYNWMFPS